MIVLFIQAKWLINYYNKKNNYNIKLIVCKNKTSMIQHQSLLSEYTIIIQQNFHQCKQVNFSIFFCLCIDFLTLIYYFKFTVDRSCISLYMLGVYQWFFLIYIIISWFCDKKRYCKNKWYSSPTFKTFRWFLPFKTELISFKRRGLS